MLSWTIHQYGFPCELGLLSSLVIICTTIDHTIIRQLALFLARHDASIASLATSVGGVVVARTLCVFFALCACVGVSHCLRHVGARTVVQCGWRCRCCCSGRAHERRAGRGSGSAVAMERLVQLRISFPVSGTASERSAILSCLTAMNKILRKPRDLSISMFGPSSIHEPALNVVNTFCRFDVHPSAPSSLQRVFHLNLCGLDPSRFRALCPRSVSSQCFDPTESASVLQNLSPRYLSNCGERATSCTVLEHSLDAVPCVPRATLAVQLLDERTRWE